MGHCRAEYILSLVLCLALAVSCTTTGPKTEADTPYLPTPQEVVSAMLDLAHVSHDDVLYDLGSGDGRIVIAAARDTGARSVGVELDPKLVRESIENAREAGVADRTAFLQQDIFRANIGDASVVTLFLLPGVNQMLRPKLLKELRPGTRLVSHMHDMAEWQADRTVRVGDSTLYLWIIPADINGSWQLSVDGIADAASTLAIRQVYQTFNGTLRGKDLRARMSDTYLRGNEIAFTVNARVAKRQVHMRFTGRVDGDAMRGNVTVDGGPFSGMHEWSAGTKSH